MTADLLRETCDLFKDRGSGCHQVQRHHLQPFARSDHNVFSRTDAFVRRVDQRSTTAEGITALQMDIKVSGVTMEVMRTALEQARRGRLHILDRMRDTLGTVRERVSAFAPRIVTIQIPVGKIVT